METKRSTFATSFYIKRSAVRNRDGKAPIMVKISVDGDDKAVGTKLFVTPDLWENGKAKGKSAEANEINGQLKEVSARLTNHYHRILREEDFVTAEKLQRLPRCRRDGELHPQRLREHESGVRGDGGERAASQVHLQQVSGCLQPFQDLPLGEEEAHRHGLQGTDQGDRSPISTSTCGWKKG